MKFERFVLFGIILLGILFFRAKPFYIAIALFFGIPLFFSAWGQIFGKDK